MSGRGGYCGKHLKNLNTRKIAVVVLKVEKFVLLYSKVAVLVWNNGVLEPHRVLDTERQAQSSPFAAVAVPVMPPEDADRIANGGDQDLANSVDPDQSTVTWVYSVCLNLSVEKLRIICSRHFLIVPSIVG